MVMVKKTYLKSRKVWKVNFELPKGECPQGVKARRVHLTGDFNNWKHTATPMPLQNDKYTASLDLEPGHNYQFRYLINGKIWTNDWHAEAYVPNNFGEDNCVLSLPLVENPAGKNRGKK